jgi:hypothetical protein
MPQRPGPYADPRPFSRISFVTGDVTANGGSILLRVHTEEGGDIDLALPTRDLHHLVTLLLILGGKAALNGRFAANSETFRPKPLPLHGVSLGVDGGDAVLTLEAGASVLSFSLSKRSMAEMGQTIFDLTSPGAPG